MSTSSILSDANKPPYQMMSLELAKNSTSGGIPAERLAVSST